MSGFSESCERLFERLGDRHDAIETGRVEQSVEAGRRAHDGDVAFTFSHPADPTDQRSQPGRVHERHSGKINDEPSNIVDTGKSLAKVPNRVGVDFTGETAEVMPLSFV